MLKRNLMALLATTFTLSISAPSFGQLLSIHDAQIAGASFAGYRIFRNNQKISMERAALQQFINNVDAEINQTGVQAEAAAAEAVVNRQGRVSHIVG